jgi:hypothetical protein
MDKTLLEEAITSGLSLRAIARKFGCSFTNVRYWVKRHQLNKLLRECCNRKPFNEVTFRKAVAESISVAGVLKAMGRAVVGRGYKRVHAEVARLGLDTSHWKGQRHGTTGQPRKLPWDEVLIENSPYRLGAGRKARLIKEGILQNQCYICGGSPEWMGQPLSLVLDHINGVRNDNRLGNIRLVCPNCNSQLPTFCGRNLKNKIAIQGESG